MDTCRLKTGYGPIAIGIWQKGRETAFVAVSLLDYGLYCLPLCVAPVCMRSRAQANADRSVPWGLCLTTWG